MARCYYRSLNLQAIVVALIVLTEESFVEKIILENCVNIHCPDDASVYL